MVRDADGGPDGSYEPGGLFTGIDIGKFRRVRQCVGAYAAHDGWKDGKLNDSGAAGSGYVL